MQMPKLIMLVMTFVLASLVPVAYADPSHNPLTLQLAHSFASVSRSGEMLGTIAVGNVDADPALEIIVNSTDGIHIYDYDGTLVTAFSTHNGVRSRQVNAPPTLFDIDGDGRDEVIFATGYEAAGDYTNTNSVFAINGEDGSMVWHMPITRDSYTAPNSGFHTIAGKFYYDNGAHDRLPAQTTFTANASAIPVYDIDGDGRLEAVVNLKIRPEPSQDYNPYINDIWGFGEFGTVGESWSGGNLILDAATGNRDYIYHFLQLSEAGLALGEVDASLGVAVFALTDSDSVVGYHKTAPHGFYGAGNLIGQFGKNARVQSGSYKRPVTLNAVDLTGDGRAEVLYEGHNIADLLWQGSRVIFDHRGRILWRKWYDFAATAGLANHWPNAAQMIPINLDGGNPEVIAWHQTNQLFYEEWDGVELISKGGHWPVSFGTEFPAPPTIGDVDGDGQEELVVARYDPTDLTAAGGLTILSQDGSVEARVDTPHGIKNIPCLSDVDRDGDLDIVARDLVGTILIYDTQQGDPGRVTWATEYRTAARTGALGTRLYDPHAPLLVQIVEGYKRVQLEWSVASEAGLSGFRIYRRPYAGGDFTLIASPSASARRFEDTGLENGVLYVYRIVAVYGEAAYPSAPVPATPLIEDNLVGNSAMELNGDHNWDKWYTGDIDWRDMIRTTTHAYQGAASMQIHLNNKGSNSSIKQWNQYGVIDAQLPVTPGQLYSFGAFIKSNLDQPSRHFIEWGSDYDQHRHDPAANPIPGREYPFYFSTHVANAAGESRWWYTNRTFVLQTGITGLSPRHRFYVDSSQDASGDVYLDNLFFRMVNTETPESITLLPFGSAWRYFEGNPPADWYAVGFDDGAWTSGPAKFGAGSGPQNVRTALPSYRERFFFRTTFDLAYDLNEWIAYGLSTTGPGGGPGIQEIYINGQYVPIQDPGLSDNPGNNVRMLDLTPFIDWLVRGKNTLAVKLENEYTATWDDVAFDFQLKGVAVTTPALQAAKYALPMLPRTGDVVTYTIQLDNPGPALSHVCVTDTLPAQLNYQGDVWASSGEYGATGGVVTWSGALSPADAVFITYTARISMPGTAALPIANTAWVDDGLGHVAAYRATVMANGYGIYLPCVLYPGTSSYLARSVLCVYTDCALRERSIGRKEHITQGQRHPS